MKCFPDNNDTWFRTCRTSSFCTVAWQLARFQLTRRIARSLGDSWASCVIQTLKQLKRISSRLIDKLTTLQHIVSSMIDEESESLVMRSDRAADESIATGFSSRHAHRQRGRMTSSMGRIVPTISKYTRLTVFFPGQPGERYNQSGYKRGKRWLGFGTAVASAGLYVNSLHLAPDR